MGMISRCPHCGGEIEIVPDIKGETLVVDAEVKDFVIDYPSGYVRLRKGRLIHHCAMTGEKGHVIR